MSEETKEDLNETTEKLTFPTIGTRLERFHKVWLHAYLYGAVKTDAFISGEMVPGELAARCVNEFAAAFKPIEENPPMTRAEYLKTAKQFAKDRRKTTDILETFINTCEENIAKAEANREEYETRTWIHKRDAAQEILEAIEKGKTDNV